LIVPIEAGELALGEDPVEGSETSYHGAVVEKDDECIGIPTLEDKVLQRAVLMLLESIYENSSTPWITDIFKCFSNKECVTAC
jgi:hypothetical protein